MITRLVWVTQYLLPILVRIFCIYLNLLNAFLDIFMIWVFGQRYEMQYYINNNHLNRDTVDFTNRIPLQFHIIYDINGAHGNNGRMIMYATVEIYQINRNHLQRDFYIRVSIIYWKKYKLSNGQCCAINTAMPCVISCPYFLEFIISDSRQEIYNTFPKPKRKENHVYVYAVTTDDAPNSKYNISIVLKELENEHIIDIANINSEEYSTAEANHRINITGKYDNVNFTVTFGKRYVCHRYTSPFFINICNAIPQIEYCDYNTGNRHCINGAVDIDCERNGMLI
ncbi:hypothetical protein HZS_4966 [Henneguya salminicola]|nr:hypothetical protein HZS_4966 [Henneguya salminicola]